GALDAWPPEVQPGANRIHFIVAVVAVLGFPQLTARGMPVEPLRIAMSVREHRRREAIVARHRAIAIEAKELSGERGDILRVVAVGGIAGAGVEQAIRSKTEPATIVNLRRWSVVEQYGALTKARVHFAVPHDAIHGAAWHRRGVVEIDEVILRK